LGFLNCAIQSSTLIHRNIIEVEGLSKSFGDLQVLKDINFLFEVGQRVAIIGQNGVGKTTLLRTLVGELEADKGKIKWSENVNIGYYAQDHSAVGSSMTNTFGFCSINLPNNILPFSPRL
jgi:ATPase subunit of ABC transporter with duplicated ATPase domains